MLRSALARAAPAMSRGFAAEAAASAKLNFSMLLPNAAVYENKEVDLVRSRHKTSQLPHQRVALRVLTATAHPPPPPVHGPPLPHSMIGKPPPP